MPPAQKDTGPVDATGLELRRVRDRELELKRLSGDISCAECRRLKLKCDKKVPCSSCVRRGCKQICPTGTTTGGNTGRQIAINAASTSISTGSDVGRKLTAMSERISVLEDALQIQSGASHPLLSSELLAIKQGVDAVQPISQKAEDDEAEEELTDAFGTLSIREDKTMRFLGASATEGVLLMQVLGGDSTHPNFDLSSLPQELVQASGMWPFAPAYLSRSEHYAQLASHLPPYERVTSLTEAYFSNLAWFIAPIDRAQVVESIVPNFYPEHRPILPELINNENIHELALLFIVLACGAVADLTLPAANPEAEKYHQLARAALGMRSFLDYASFAACQTVFLMGSYEIYSGHKTTQESSWKLMAIGMLIASSIGLHRDPSRWKLDVKTVNWRRRTFWEVNTVDKWRSLGSGRPMNFPNNAIDCEYPLDRGATVEEDGVVVESVWQWRYRFTRDVLAYLTEKICAARPPKYSDIMEMDRAVRAFDLHPFVYQRPKPNYAFATEGDFRNLHPYITLWWKEMALLYIHRSCFARAMLEYRSNPMKSPYSASFLTTYRSATVLLKILRDASDRLSLILERMWSLWSISLSCAVIVGSVACRPSTINFAASALNELEKAINIFEMSTRHPVARNGLNLLYRMRDKANSAIHAHNSRSRSASATTSDGDKQNIGELKVSRFPLTPSELAGDDEELNILRGTTRYVEERSFPPERAIEGLHHHNYLTYDGPSSSNSSSCKSPEMPQSSASGSGSSSQASDSRRSDFSTTFSSLDPLMAPSPFVQGSSGYSSHTPGTPATSYDSPELTQDMCDPYDNYLPPFVEASHRGVERTKVWPGSSGDQGGDIPMQPGGQHQQIYIELNQAHSTQPGNQQPPTSFPFSGTQAFPANPLVPTDASHAEHNKGYSTGIPNTSTQFKTTEQDMFPSYDYTYDPTSIGQSYFTGPTPDPQVLANLNALYQKADGGNIEVWDSFMQAFELTNNVDSGQNESWEAMVFP